MAIDVYIIGMSNTDAIKAALVDYKGSVRFHIDRLNPRLENGGFFQKRLDPEFFRDRLTQARLVVLSLWGNWYNTLALVEHAEPFDFVYPTFDERVDETRRIIPFMQISRSFRNGIREQLRMLNILRPMTQEKMILLEPPPPIESEEHIRKYPGPFVEALSAGITPAGIRLKLWKLQSSMYREVCAEHGIDFIPFLSEATSTNGFLAADYCFPDPGHANAKYGMLMLDELAEMFRDLK